MQERARPNRERERERMPRNLTGCKRKRERERERERERDCGLQKRDGENHSREIVALNIVAHFVAIDNHCRQRRGGIENGTVDNQHIDVGRFDTTLEEHLVFLE